MIGSTFHDPFLSITSFLYGSGTGNIWLERVLCSGNETKLSDCSIEYTINQFCFGVGVSCLPFSKFRVCIAKAVTTLTYGETYENKSTCSHELSKACGIKCNQSLVAMV